MKTNRTGRSYTTDARTGVRRTEKLRPAGGLSGASEHNDLIGLYIRYLSSPTQERCWDFLVSSMRHMARRIGYLVHQKHMFPKNISPNTFSTDVYPRACHKFWAELHTLRSPGAFITWLNGVAYSAVIEEIREHTRRLKQGPCVSIPLSVELSDGSVMSVLDQPDCREAAQRQGTAPQDERRIMKQLVYRDLLGKLFRLDATVSERDREGVRLLHVMYERDLTIAELAEEVGKPKAEITTLVRSAREKLRRIAVEQYKFTAKDLDL